MYIFERGNSTHILLQKLIYRLICWCDCPVCYYTEYSRLNLKPHKQAHKHTMTQLSVWPKVIKRTVNKLRTSWQLPTKIDLHFPPSLLFLWPFFLFALPCRLSPFLPSSSLFGLLQKVDSFPLYKNCVYYCFICPLILFSFLFSHTTIHLAPHKSCQKSRFFSWFYNK